MTEREIKIIRAALIRARYCYCADESEHGGDGMKNPDESIKAAFDLVGLTWHADQLEIFHSNEWAGNDQFRP
jgi:hypothetical protein